MRLDTSYSLPQFCQEGCLTIGKSVRANAIFTRTTFSKHSSRGYPSMRLVFSSLGAGPPDPTGQIVSRGQCSIQKPRISCRSSLAYLCFRVWELKPTVATVDHLVAEMKLEMAVTNDVPSPRDPASGQRKTISMWFRSFTSCCLFPLLFIYFPFFPVFFFMMSC